ncbi:MAG: WYL domain-containing protein [Oscillospiraceae bacterium]
MNIEQVRGKRTEYRLLDREFQLAELKLLVDTVGASRFITRKKSLELIKKLEAQASRGEARELHRQVYVDKRVKSMNESIYYNTDAIYSAINDDKKLSFKYFEYSRDKQRVFRHDGKEYKVSPLALIYSDENYYLAAYNPVRGAVASFRVDRMTDVSALGELREANEATRNFDPARAADMRFSMYTGTRENVVIMFDNSLTTVIIDRFGADVTMLPVDANHFKIDVEVEISPNFYSWIFMFGNRAYIMGPKKTVEDFAKMIHSVSDNYPQSE